MLIDVLLVVGDDGLGDSLTDGVDLGSVTTTGDTDADVDTGELVSADDQEGLVDLFVVEETTLEKKKKGSCWLIQSVRCRFGRPSHSVGRVTVPFVVATGGVVVGGR